MCIYLLGKVLFFFLSSQRPCCQCQHLSPWLPTAHFGSCAPGDGKRQIELNVLWKSDSFQCEKHLMIPPFFCFSEWPPPPTLALILAGAWLTGTIIAMEIGAMTFMPACANGNMQSRSAKDAAMRAAFLSEQSCGAAWIRWKVASLRKRQVLRLSCHSETPQLFHPSQQKWMDLAFLFILSNVNLSFG